MENQLVELGGVGGLSEENLDDYKFFNRRFNGISSNWKEVENLVRSNREARKFKIDLAALREDGRIKPDETFIPTRTIDTNIRREKPQSIRYFNQSPRAVVLQPNGFNIPGEIIAKLENEVTRCIRYEGWLVEFMKIIDACAQNAWAFMQLNFDGDKPGHLSFEYIPTDDLIFDLDTVDIYEQEMVIHRKYLTRTELQRNVYDYKWNKEVVDSLVARSADHSNTSSGSEARDRTYPVYECFYKKVKKGEPTKIRHAWAIKNGGNWLRKPRDLYLGRDDLITGVPVAESEYPIFCLKYEETEEQQLKEAVGRGDMDTPTQEAASELISVFINTAVRSHNLLGSPKQLSPDSDGAGAPKQTDVVIDHGTIYDRPMEFYNLPAPDSSIPNAYQLLTTKNMQESSQVDFATNNRKDSEKTATEIQAAENKAAELGSTQVTLRSLFSQKLFSRFFEIWQNRVLQDQVRLNDPMLLDALRIIPQQQQSPDSAEMVMPEMILVDYSVRPAGDIDVVARNEKIQKQLNLSQIILPVPGAGQELIKDIIRNNFPDEAGRYLEAMAKADQQQQLLVQLIGMIEELMTDEEGKLKPEFANMNNQLESLKGLVTGQPEGQ